jgi:hypothetical protein
VNVALGVDGDEDPVVQIEGKEANNVRDVTACLMARGATKWCLGLARKPCRSSIWARFGSDCVKDVDLAARESSKACQGVAPEHRTTQGGKERSRGCLDASNSTTNDVDVYRLW